VKIQIQSNLKVIVVEKGGVLLDRAFLKSLGGVEKRPSSDMLL
jgi:hypothetical protein